MSWKHIIRRLLQSPMFSILTIATLALGIGANSAIFSVVNGILLKPLPYPQPEQLIAVEHVASGINMPHPGIAPFMYFTYRGQAKTFDHLGMWETGSVSVTGLAEPEQVDSISVTFDVLPALGVRPLLGRWFSEKDDLPGAEKTTILMYAYWQLRFGGDRSIIGRRIVINGEANEVIGVMPENFRFLDRKPVLFQTYRLDRSKIFVGNFGYNGIARLKPGVTLSQATADVARLLPIALHTFPVFPGVSLKVFEDARLGPDLQPLKQKLVGDIGTTLWILMATIGMVLLIACANVANLMLVRTEGRRHELAIRAALGAGRLRIARETLGESVALGLFGGAIGLAVAFAAVRVIVAIGPAHLPRLDQISVDGWGVLFTFSISILAGLLFGAIPVIKCAAPGLELRAGGRSMSQSRERHRARGVLVVVQVALALLLLIGSGLMIRTLQALHNVQAGFTNALEVQTLRISIPASQVKDPDAVARMEQAILEKMKSISGVSAAGAMSAVPLSGTHWFNPIYAEGRDYGKGEMPPLRFYNFISPGMLGAMGYQIVAGREMTWDDVLGKRPVVMLSENLARELWGDPAAAIGKRIREISAEHWYEVVGVVADVRQDGVDRNAPKMVYWPLLLANFFGEKTVVRPSLSYVIRSRRTGTRGFLEDLEQAVWSVNPNLPLAQVETLQSVYEKSLARTSFTLVLLTIAGAMAMLIGLVGIYGVISYSVSQRTREIGIRVALGAPKREVLRMFVTQAILLSAIGTACGLVGAVALTRWMSSLLFGVSATDPATYAVVGLLLLCAAIASSVVPAIRATAVDPVEALRAE